MLHSLRFALASIVVLVASSTAFAIDRVVPSTQYPTIQSAIDAAVNGDVVRVGSGIYNERLNLLGKQITVRGAGQFLSIVDPQGGGGHLVTCVSGETTSSVLEGFTLRLSPTGAIYLSGSGLTVRQCRIQSNSGTVGAAVFADHGSTVSFDACTINFNSASSEGGAIHVAANGSATLVGCTLQGNSAERGGAIATQSGSTLNVTNCNFIGNTGREGGGALRMNSTSGTIASTQFTENTTASDRRMAQGGSVWIEGVGPSFGDCGFSGCRARSEPGGWNEQNLARGGSVYMGSFARARFDRCSWNGCAVSARNTHPSNALGGAVYCEYASLLQLGDCAFTGCVSDIQAGGCCGGGSARGGAIFAHFSSASIERCAFQSCRATANNNSAAGGAILLENYASPTVLDSEFRSCEAISGGAVYMSGRSSPAFGRCEFVDCESGVEGGAVVATDAPGLFFDSLFERNAAPTGSVMFATGTELSTLSGNSFCSNLGTDIVGAYVNGGDNDFAKNCPEDCNANGLNDAWDLDHGFMDCDANGTLDVCDIAATPERDCNGDGILDSCQAGKPGAGDCDADGVPDACEDDCDSDGIPDDCAIADDVVPDCNMNGVPDSCDLASMPDCNGNQVPDACDPDCDLDGVPDSCEIASGASDCNADGVPDSCEIAAAPSLDVNKDGQLDSCQPGMQFAGLQVEIVPIVGRSSMPGLPAGAVCYRVYARVSDPAASVVGIYGNATHPMVISAAGGFWNAADGADIGEDLPCDLTGLPPETRFDSWLTIGSECDSSSGVEVAYLDFGPFNKGAGIAESDGAVFVLPGLSQSVAGADRRVLVAQLTVNAPVALQGSFNLVGRNSSGEPGAPGSWMAVAQQIPAPDLLDCNGNGTHDAFDVASGTATDCDENGVPDSCQSTGGDDDCNGNGVPDLCDVASGTSADQNGNGVPDECECLEDLDGNGRVDVDDLVAILVHWGGDASSGADVDGDGWVDAKDLGLVLAAWGPCDR